MNNFKNIVIPSLQRDYVQGNQYDKIEPFIEYLLDGLNSDNGIDLNYIYGIENDEGKTFYPIDGQQRLTTLWLLRMYLTSKANINNPTDKKVLEQKLIYQTREYAHDFCMEMSEHINELFTTQCKLVKIEEQNWFIDAWRHDTTVRGCISTLEIIDRKFGNNNAVKMLENFDRNLHYTIESLNDNDVNGDIYIKMNGRGVPLTEYENLKSWLDKKVEDLFGKDNSCFVSNWRICTDNKWTDMVWENLNESQKSLIDNYQLRLLYTLTFLYWRNKNLAGSIEDSDSNLENLSISLGIEYYDNKDILKEEIADKILHKILKRDNFGLSLYVLDRLPIFNKDALMFIAASYDKLYSRRKELNDLKIENENEVDRKLYFWKANKETTLFFQMFLDETLESIPYGKLALCYSVVAYPDKKISEDFYEWMYRMRNLIINQDIHNGNIDSVMESIDKMSEYLSVSLAVSFDLIFRSAQYEDALKAFTKQQRDEEKHKISIKDIELQRFIRSLENHPFFVGQIKFMFNFCGIESESDNLIYKNKFIRYAEVMKCLFDENGFAKRYDHWRLRRALLGCSVHYGFGYERSSNWNFLSSRSDKKRFISDCESYEEQPHNKCLQSVVEVIADKVFDNYDSELKIQDIDINGILNEIAEDKFRSGSKPITDWRKYFYDKYIWDYMEQHNVRWNSDYDIYLMKKIRWNGEHVDIRVYHLYNKLKNLQGFENGCWKDWKYDIWSYEESCVYLEKKFNDKPLVIDIKHDNGTDNCFKFNVFVRDDKEKTKKLTEFTNELPGELSNDKYVIRDSITFEEIKDKIKTVIEVLEANKSYLF